MHNTNYNMCTSHASHKPGWSTLNFCILKLKAVGGIILQPPVENEPGKTHVTDQHEHALHSSFLSL